MAHIPIVNEKCPEVSIDKLFKIKFKNMKQS